MLMLSPCDGLVIPSGHTTLTVHPAYFVLSGGLAIVSGSLVDHHLHRPPPPAQNSFWTQ